MVLELILGLAAVAGTAAVSLRWPARRRQLLYGALFSLPILGLELLAAGRLERLGTSLAGAVEYVVLTTVAVMGLGGLAAVVADVTVNRWLTPTVYHRRHALGWLTVGVIGTAVLTLFGVSLGLSLVIGLLANVLLILFLDRQLLWDALVGASSLAVWFVLADVVLGIRASGDIQSLLLGGAPIGLTLFGLPLERVLTGAMVGALLGPLFSATKRLRAAGLPEATTVPHAKVVLGLVLTALGVLTMGGVSYAFVLPPAVAALEPADDATVAVSTTALTVEFTRPIDRDTLDLSVTPDLEGIWVFERPAFSDHGFRRARFVFDTPLIPGTRYSGAVTDVRSVWGLAGPDVPFSFTTPAAVPLVPIPAVVPPSDPTPDTASPPATNTAPPPATNASPAPTTPPPATPEPIPTPQHILNVQQDYQDSPLSCEAAALKMALAGAGIRVTESQIMDRVGYDPTPHVGDVWGDPNQAFVGNIAGKQNTTGYGVHWGPIAKAANHWHAATIVRGWTPEQVAAAIWDDHPVIVWGTIGRAYRDSWRTPAGATVAAWKGEHARTVIGVIGTAENPVSFILNDPVAGRITWSRATLDANWAAFDHNGVVLR